jgi:hypothetical protein
MDDNARKILTVALLAVALSIAIVLLYPSGQKPLCVSEGFQNVVLDCPANTKSFIDAKGNTNCCKGKLNGNKCEGPVACTLSAGGVSKDVPHCMYYSHEGLFNPQNQQIHSTGNSENLCWESTKATTVAKKCSDSLQQKFTYTKDKQIKSKDGKCLMGINTSKFGKPFIFYNLENCKNIKEQRFTYRMDKSLQCEAFPDTSVSILQHKKNKNDAFLASFVNVKDAMKAFREGRKNVTYNIDYNAVEKEMNNTVQTIKKEFNTYTSFDVLPDSAKMIPIPSAMKKYMK